MSQLYGFQLRLENSYYMLIFKFTPFVEVTNAFNEEYNKMGNHYLGKSHGEMGPHFYRGRQRSNKYIVFF
jgi:hypothetical protein